MDETAVANIDAHMRGFGRLVRRGLAAPEDQVAGLQGFPEAGAVGGFNGDAAVGLLGSVAGKENAIQEEGAAGETAAVHIS